MTFVAWLQIAVLAAGAAAQAPGPPPVVPPHTPSQLLSRLYQDNRVPREITLVCPPATMVRTPGFNPAYEDELTARFGPAYGGYPTPCVVSLSPWSYPKAQVAAVQSSNR